MTLPDVLLTREDFENSNFNQIIQGCSEQDCHVFSESFSKTSQKAREENSATQEAVFSLLSAVTSFHFTPESPKEPFVPLFQMQGRRGIIPSDFTENNVKSLEMAYELIKNPELKARVADVLWLLRHDHIKAETAVFEYLESAKVVEDPDMWPPAADRIERALRIAITLRNPELLKKVVSHIEITIAKYRGLDPKFFSHKLMEFLIEVKQGNLEIYIPLTKKIATDAESARDWYKARAYYKLLSEWNILAKDDAAKQDALIKEANTYINEAESSITANPPSYLGASIHLQKAIEAYRRIGGQQNKVSELNGKLIAYQKEIPNEMQIISNPVDLTEISEQSVNQVKGKSFDEALRVMALLCKSPSKERLEKRVKDIMNKHPLQFIMSHIGINEAGKVIARREPASLSGDGTDDGIIRAAMYEQAHTIDIPLNTQGVIDPVRKQISSEHHGEPRDFGNLLSNNPFVPPRREFLYARALSAGLQGDLVEFACLAIPQIENSIRYALAQNAIPTSGIDSEGIQNEYDLNKLLFMPEVKAIFGEDTTFDLQGLLVVHAGANLRNRFAHGLMDENSFYTVDVLYLWWLTIRILVLGNMAKMKTAKNPKK